MQSCLSLLTQHLPKSHLTQWLPYSRAVFVVLSKTSFTTSSTAQTRQRLTLRSRRIRNAEGSTARLRLACRKTRYRNNLRTRIALGVQWRGKLPEQSPRRIRGVSRVKYVAAGQSRHIQRRLPYRPVLQSTQRLNLLSGRRPVRTKYVWLGGWARSSNAYEDANPRFTIPSGPFLFDTSWTTRFHRMAEQGENVNLYLSLRYTKVEQLVRKYAGLNVSVRSTYQAWMHIPPEHRLQVWQDVMLWCLHNNPRRALKLLLASMKGHHFRPPRHVVGDCLQHLAKQFLHKVTNPDPRTLESLYHLVYKYVDGGSKVLRAQHIPDQVVFLMLKHCGDSEVMSLLQKFTEENVQLHANTLLHALNRSLDVGNVNQSLRLLRFVSKSGFGMHRAQVQSSCVRLVRAQYNVRDPFSIQIRILTQILEMGVRPDIALYNAILLTTVEAGYFDLAQQMFEIAKVNHLKPDSITYRILLKGALLNADKATRWKLVRELESNHELLRDSSVLSDLLHTIFKIEEPAYPAMLALYKHHCDLRPLKELGMCRQDEQQALDCADSPKDIWPSASVLGQMICAYTEMHKYSDSLIDDYHRYHYFVSQNHPIIAPITRSDHVANAFLIAFGLREKTLPLCTTVVKNMLDDSNSKRDSVQHESTQPAMAAPSVITWSILARAFFRHNQNRAAEKVLDLMHERGIEPDQVTWNTIIGGYSSMQKVEKAVDAIKRMEVAGFSPDQRTFQGLSKAYNPDRLLGVMEKILDGGKGFEGKGLSIVQEGADSTSDEVEMMASDWETEDTSRGIEVYKYLKERYQKLAAEHRRGEDPNSVLVEATS